MGVGAIIGGIAGEVVWSGLIGVKAFGVFDVTMKIGFGVPGFGVFGIVKTGQELQTEYTNPNGQSYNQNIATMPTPRPKDTGANENIGEGNGGEKGNDTVNPIRNFYNSNQALLRGHFNSAEIAGGTAEIVGFTTAVATGGAGLAVSAEGFTLSLIGTVENVGMDLIEGQVKSAVNRVAEFGFYYGMGRAIKSGVPQQTLQDSLNAFQSYFSTYIMPVFKDSWDKSNSHKKP